MVCPVFLGPVSLVYCVVIFSPSSGAFSASGLAASACLVSALGTSALGCSFSTFGFATFPSTLGAGVASTSAFASSSGFAFSAFGAKSILPTAFGF